MNNNDIDSNSNSNDNKNTTKTITMTIMILNACTMNFLTIIYVCWLIKFLLDFALYDSQIRNMIKHHFAIDKFFYVIVSFDMNIAIINVCIVFNIAYICIVFVV